MLRKGSAKSLGLALTRILNADSIFLLCEASCYPWISLGTEGYFYGEGEKLVRFPQESGKRCGSSQGGTGLASLFPFSRGGLEVTHYNKRVSWVC